MAFKLRSTANTSRESQKLLNLMNSYIVDLYPTTFVEAGIAV